MTVVCQEPKPGTRTNVVYVYVVKPDGEEGVVVMAKLADGRWHPVLSRPLASLPCKADPKAD